LHRRYDRPARKPGKPPDVAYTIHCFYADALKHNDIPNHSLKTFNLLSSILAIGFLQLNFQKNTTRMPRLVAMCQNRRGRKKSRQNKKNSRPVEIK